MTRFFFILLFWLGIMSSSLAQDEKPAEAPAEAPQTPAPTVQEVSKTPAVENKDMESESHPKEEPPAPPQEPPTAPPPPQPDETTVFNAAVAAYNDNLFERAGKEFGEFRNKYPQSTILVNATVYQGLSLYREGKYAEMLNFFRPLITDTNVTALSEGKDRYRYWSGMASFKLGDYTGTISFLDSLVKEQPNSSLVPQSLYYMGTALRRLGDNKKVIDLFENPGGIFFKTAEKEPNNVYVIQGRLLLAEMHLIQNEFAQTQAVLDKVADNNLPPELQWHRLYLQTRLSLAQQDVKGAGQNVTNLLVLTTNLGLLNLEYQGLALQGDLLKQENRMEEAAQVYEKNLANKLLSLEDRRMALMNTVRIRLDQKKQDTAIKLLENFMNEMDGKPYNDEILVTLGNLYLQNYYQGTASVRLIKSGRGVGNPVVGSAFNCYTNLIGTFTNSVYLPKAFLDLGLCYWELGDEKNAQIQFEKAVDLLPASKENAFARVKLAELQFYRKEFVAVLGTLAEYMKNYEEDKIIPAELQEQAYHIQLCAAIELGEEEQARKTMNAVRERYPKGVFTERDLICFGNFLCDIGKPAEGRFQFQECLKLSPESSILPEISYSQARSWLYERKFDEAVSAYREWLEHNPETSPNYITAQFELIWCCAQRGDENASKMFQDFSKKYPDSFYSILARKWIADDHFNKREFTNAELVYQSIYGQTNVLTDTDSFALNARLMAARTAFNRGGYKDASVYLTSLINILLENKTGEDNMLDESFILLGDSLSEQVKLTEDYPKQLERFAEAINAYSRVSETNQLGGVALTRIANCHFQLASRDSVDMKRLELAQQFYEKAMAAPQNSVATRSKAELGLAALYQFKTELPSQSQKEKNEFQDQALAHYLNVFYGNDGDTKEFDPFSIQKAGMEAGRIMENRGQWKEARGVYERLLTYVPSLQPLLKKKIAYAMEQYPSDRE